MAVGSAQSDGRGSIVEATGSVGTRIVDKNYPCVEGISGAITYQEDVNLIPIEAPSDG